MMHDITMRGMYKVALLQFPFGRFHGLQLERLGLKGHELYSWAVRRLTKSARVFHGVSTEPFRTKRKFGMYGLRTGGTPEFAERDSGAGRGTRRMYSRPSYTTVSATAFHRICTRGQGCRGWRPRYNSPCRWNARKSCPTHLALYPWRLFRTPLRCQTKEQPRTFRLIQPRLLPLAISLLVQSAVDRSIRSRGGSSVVLPSSVRCTRTTLLYSIRLAIVPLIRLWFGALSVPILLVVFPPRASYDLTVWRCQ